VVVDDGDVEDVDDDGVNADESSITATSSRKSRSIDLPNTSQTSTLSGFVFMYR